MARRKDKDTKVHESFEGDVIVTPEGYNTLGIQWYIRQARAAVEARDWYDAWLMWGSALARSTDPAETFDLRQLERKAQRLMNPRKDRKKDKEMRRKRQEYA